MSEAAIGPAERLVDLVLGDLWIGDRMFVGRRLEPGEDEIVLQAGEDGRHRLGRPDLGTDATVAEFVARLQGVVCEVYERGVPRCPLHEHTLLPDVRDGSLSWVCPDDEWRCAAGHYHELDWPPRADEGGVPRLLIDRLNRHGVAGLRSVRAELSDGRWVGKITAWPVNEEFLAQVRAAAAPMPVEVTPVEPPPPGAWQQSLDRRLEEELVWARWAVGRWAEFPVDERPRPLVLLGGPVLGPERGFESNGAKLAYLEGLFDWRAEVPDQVRALLKAEAAERPPSERPMTPIRIARAERAEASFRTDRGPRMLPAWLLYGEEVGGPIAVLDPEIAKLAWEPDDSTAAPSPPLRPPPRDPGARIELAADGRTARFGFVGAAPEYEHYPEAIVIESRTAVAIVPVAIDSGWRGARRAIGIGAEVVVQFAEPLGARVFVDVHGHAGEAVPAGEDQPVRSSTKTGISRSVFVA